MKYLECLSVEPCADGSVFVALDDGGVHDRIHVGVEPGTIRVFHVPNYFQPRLIHDPQASRELVRIIGDVLDGKTVTLPRRLASTGTSADAPLAA